MRKILIPLGLLLLTSLSFAALLKPGYFPMHDDIQLMRVWEMRLCLQDNQIPCRWVPDMALGYGYPQFNFYPPLPYYLMSLINLAGASLVNSVKAGFLLTFLLALWGMYHLAEHFWQSRWAGAASSLLYLYLPYRAMNVYVRGAMGEIWAMAWFPWIFYFLDKYLLTKDKNHWLGLSLSLAALATSHLISLLMLLPLLIAWTLVRLARLDYRHSGIGLLIDLATAGILGASISAFYWLPAMLEKSSVHIDSMIMGYFNYISHFVGLNQLLFNTHWGYGSSLAGPYDDISFLLGIWHWLLPITGMIIIWLNRRSSTADRYKLTGLVIAGWLYLFMIHPRSLPIWQIIPPLAWLQFPWRFLAVAGFVFSLSAGWWGKLVTRVKAMTKPAAGPSLLALICLLVIMFSFSYFSPRYYYQLSDSDVFQDPLWRKYQTISIFDYLPRSADLPPTTRAPQQPQVLQGSAVITDWQTGTNWAKFQASAKQDSLVQVPIINWLGWRVMVDKKPVSLADNGPQGEISFWLPAGNHQIEVRLLNTPVRLIGNSLTVVGLFSWWIKYLLNRWT